MVNNIEDIYEFYNKFRFGTLNITEKTREIVV